MAKTLKELFSKLGGPNQIEKAICHSCEKNIKQFARNVTAEVIEMLSGESTWAESINRNSFLAAKKFPRRNIAEILPKLRQKCRLFSDFEDGYITNGIRATDEIQAAEELQKILAGIALSLIHVDGGADYFLSKIKEFDYPSSRPESWEAQVAFFESRYGNPQSCDGFCPNSPFCNHAANMLLTAR